MLRAKASLVALVILALLGMHGLVAGWSPSASGDGTALTVTFAAMGSTHAPPSTASLPVHEGRSEFPDKHHHVETHDHCLAVLSASPLRI
jgi:hypothetical protein